MQKILVIGPGGAGKSTFAKQLGETLNIKVVHLDSLYWKAGWVEPPKKEWAATLQQELERDRWIIDGNYSGTLEMRMEACDAVVFLDLPRPVCTWRVIKRAIRYRNRTRPDMADGCPEKLSLEFLRWIWNYRRRTRPKILKLLTEQGQGRVIIRLQSSRQVEQYLANIKNGNTI
ncbi:MAG TPA: DNA topology modulation protein [Pyrinomonadaceae bacterium]|jgi:adenylate kinase family enzyme|nr:DNA topology modulation protein [Pyrinomonadaceae bacterium]